MMLYYVPSRLNCNYVRDEPWSSVVPEKSPFVELFVLVGFACGCQRDQLCVLTSAASSLTAASFSTSRMLFGLAQEGVAPKAFLNSLSAQYPRKG
ncbi:hypothetical protein [Escherichia coli]|uniref:hypothetical protein n=1 Tax=Escherichia coli TaxID=562 RepID=UPI003989FBC5